jgi:hypothetical protein
LRLARAASLVLAVGIIGLPVSAQELGPEAASAVFARARHLAARDSGGLWQKSLLGPILLVDPSDRTAIASAAAPGLSPESDVWQGVLPEDIGIANTAFSWEDEWWTMLRWPIPSDTISLDRLLAHELWHRIQADIGFPSTGPANEHLGSRNGRYWLVLEFRGLRQALLNPDDRTPALDALRFRAERHRLFPESADQERALIMHEGLAQYTGFALSGLGAGPARELAADELLQAEEADSFVRSFAYPLGAAYGLLLDLHSPNWTRGATPNEDLGDLLARAMAAGMGDSLRTAPTPPASGAPDIAGAAARYDGETLGIREDGLDKERKVRLAEQTRRYVTGPLLVLEFRHMNVSFDPGQVDVLPGHGNIYRSLTLSDDWGKLVVTGGGLIRSDWSAVVVPGPPSGDVGQWVGDGYVLDLRSEWVLVPSTDGGPTTVRLRD